MPALLALLLSGCTADSSPTEEPSPAEEADTDTDADTDADADADTDTDTEEVSYCGESDAFEAVYAEVIARWEAQDAAQPWPAGGLVFVGSSSIRRWEELSRLYAARRPIQRGFGGAQAGEVAQAAEALVGRHDPAGVVVFAGTNDVAAGVPSAVVVERVRCLRQRVPEGAPLLFIGITPTPLRWAQWEEAAAVNAAVEALAEEDAGLVYVDVPSAFLETGSPPDDSLFVSDGLHLSPSGYALWDSVLRAEVDAAMGAAPSAPAPGVTLGVGERILVDLGPSNAEDGERSGCPDYLGQCWNDWHPRDGDAAVLPGEHLDGLVTAAGEATDVGLVITGGFLLNGRSHGGLLWPSAERLGGLAVGTATGDFFYALPNDSTGGFYLRGLDPAGQYTLRLFAAREDGEHRVTRYSVYGADSDAAAAAVSLQTSGAGAGSAGGVTNDDTVAEMTGVRPDAGGRLHVDVEIEAGSYAYVSLLELIREE